MTGQDGQQWLSQPDGSRPGYVFEPVQNLAVTDYGPNSMEWGWSYEDTGHTGFDIELHVPGIWDVWTRLDVASPNARSYRIGSGLPAGEEIGFRIRATDEATPTITVGMEQVVPDGG